MRVWFTIVVIAVGVLLGGLAGGAVFNSLFFHRFLVNTHDARLLTVALDVRDVFARAVALGLPLNQFDGGKQVLDEARRFDPAITEIQIFQVGAAGFVSLGLGGAVAERPLPAEWHRAMLRAPEARHWQVDGPVGFGVLVPVNNSFGTTIGLMAFLQSRDVVVQPQHRFDLFLAAVALGGGLLGGVVLLLVLPLVVRAGLARLRPWAAHVDALIAAAETPDAPLPEQPAVGMAVLDEILAEPLARLRAELAERRTSGAAP